MRLAALTLLLAAGAAAQPGPTTPGPAGAEAAVVAVAAAQQNRDWEAVSLLLEPELVVSLGRSTRSLVQMSARAIADSAARAEFDDPEMFVRMRQRLAALVPPDSVSTDEEAFIRVLAADGRRRRRLERTYTLGETIPPTTFRLVGSVAEADTLVHVVGYTVGPLQSPTTLTSELEMVTTRWTSGRWVVVLRRSHATPLLEHLRRATRNWTEIIGREIEDPEGETGGDREDG